MLAILVPLMLAAVAPSDTDRSALEKRFVEIYKPYASAENRTASWDFPIWSAEVTALIAQWRSVTPQDEPDAMSDGDWLCQCQDWDAEAFSATITSIGMVDEGVAEVAVSIDLGFAEETARQETLTFRRENGVWKLDDIVAEFLPQGLKQKLRETIAENTARIGERG